MNTPTETLSIESEPTARSVTSGVVDSGALLGSVVRQICFTCKHWQGKRRKQTAYCHRLHISGIDAPSGDSSCVLWEKRINARLTLGVSQD